MWWHTVTHGRGSEGETGDWSGQPVPFTLPRNMVYPVLLPLMRTPRLSVVEWTDDPADLNGLVRFVERRNLVSVRVPSHFKRTLTTASYLGGPMFKSQSQDRLSLLRPVTVLSPFMKMSWHHPKLWNHSFISHSFHLHTHHPTNWHHSLSYGWHT